MQRTAAVLILALLSLPLASARAATPLDARLAELAASVPAGFSAERGRVLHERAFAGGKPETPACASCHGDDPRDTGRTPAGKAVEPMALSVAPQRYADPAKVEKWFRRNCRDVLGRECTPQEKGDWLSYMRSR